MKKTFELLVIDKQTESGKIYPMHVVEKMISAFNRRKSPMVCVANSDYINPENNSPGTIILERASHVLIDLYIDNNILMCEIETLNTAHGKILDRVLDIYPDQNLICSVAGMGDVIQGIVQDFKLFNITINPNWRE